MYIISLELRVSEEQGNDDGEQCDHSMTNTYSCHDIDSDNEEENHDYHISQTWMEIHHQQILSDSETEETDDDIRCYAQDNQDVPLIRKASDEEKARITAELVNKARSNYHLRNRVVGGARSQPSGVFIKENKIDIKYV